MKLSFQQFFLLTDKYYVRGCTALLDAVGGAIHHIGNVHKYAREEDRPENPLFIITTDGMENSSRIYSYDKVKVKLLQGPQYSKGKMYKDDLMLQVVGHTPVAKPFLNGSITVILLKDDWTEK